MGFFFKDFAKVFSATDHKMCLCAHNPGPRLGASIRSADRESNSSRRKLRNRVCQRASLKSVGITNVDFLHVFKVKHVFSEFNYHPESSGRFNIPAEQIKKNLLVQNGFRIKIQTARHTSSQS